MIMFQNRYISLLI